MGDPLAQLVEHHTFNVGVLGSNPKRITKRQKGNFLEDSLFFGLQTDTISSELVYRTYIKFTNVLYKSKFCGVSINSSNSVIERDFNP